MKILDLTAGKRAVWFDKSNPLATFLDIRPEMDPDIVCDTKKLPAEVGSDFNLVVYDPPHLACGPNGNFGKRYGSFSTAQILESIEGTAPEAHRVTCKDALMAFKWNTHDIKLERVLSLLSPYWMPLFGHHTKYGHRSHTFWVMLKRGDL